MATQPRYSLGCTFHPTRCMVRAGGDVVGTFDALGADGARRFAKLIERANLAEELAGVARLLHQTAVTDREWPDVYARYRAAMDTAKVAGLL